MIRNIRVFNRASIRLVAKGTVACTLVVDNVLDAIVVVLESSLVVENVTLELLKVISREGAHHGGNGRHRVLARAEAEAALKTDTRQSGSASSNSWAKSSEAGKRSQDTDKHVEKVGVLFLGRRTVISNDLLDTRRELLNRLLNSAHPELLEGVEKVTHLDMHVECLGWMIRNTLLALGPRAVAQREIGAVVVIGSRLPDKVFPPRSSTTVLPGLANHVDVLGVELVSTNRIGILVIVDALVGEINIHIVVAVTTALASFAAVSLRGAAPTTS
ncbi:hypothetical protein HG530_006490 [Fusarium avenaceum]|nr:hypothetical protein HG530_006490 [Fusarium avenaceum]